MTITPGITAGYYYGRTFGYNNWYLADPNGTIGDLTDDIIWRQHVAIKKGVSDVVPSVTLSVTKDGWYFTVGLLLGHRADQVVVQGRAGAPVLRAARHGVRDLTGVSRCIRRP